LFSNSDSVVKPSTLLRSTLIAIVCVDSGAVDVVEPDAAADEAGLADGLVSADAEVEVSPTDVEVSFTDAEVVSEAEAGSGSKDVENISGSGSRISRFVEVVPTASKNAKRPVLVT
jgi:hypothetical protein